MQPRYSAAVTALADALVGLEEHGERVTTLRAGGDRIHLYSTLRRDGQPANSYDAEVLHFYLVPCLAVSLAWPRPRGWRRAVLLLGLLAAMLLFHAAALLITVEHTYAVTLAEVARRNYGPAAAGVYGWLKETFIYFAVQLMPAAVMVGLFALYGSPLADPREAAARTGRPARGGRFRTLAWALPLAALAIAGGTGLRAHLGKVEARQAESICVRAFDALLRQDARAALPLFRESIRLKPSFLEARDGLGQSLLGLGRHAEAESAFREALRIDPDYLPSLLGIASALEALDRPGEAILGLERAVASHPEDPAARTRLGIAYARASRFREAVPVLEEAVSLDPDGAEPLFFLAQALVSADRLCEALPRLEEYLRRDAGSRRADLVRRQAEQGHSICGVREGNE